jgi:hypothetical protein
MGHTTLFEQETHARVEALFADAESARAAAVALAQRFDLDPARISQLTPEQRTRITQRNKLDHRASARVLERRQLKFTFIAFALLLAGMLCLHLLNEQGLMSAASVTLGLVLLIAAAVGLTVHGLLSWRHVRVREGGLACAGDGVLLVIDLHDVSEQYDLCRALEEMGVTAHTVSIAGDT